jgi:hypothetical protein
VISLADRRRRTYRIITGVAAASVLTVGGIAALQSSGSDDLASVATDAKIATAAPADADAARSAPAETAVMFDTAAATADTSAPAETAAPAEMSTGGAPETAMMPTPLIADPQMLAAYAASIPATLASTAGPGDSVAPVGDGMPTALPCATEVGGAERLGEIVYAGEPALALRLADGRVQAVSLTTCAVLADVTP